MALLIYLATSPGKTASREHLLNLLWSDVPPERGLRTLRQTIFQLRQTLGENAITSAGRDLSLALEIAYDRDEFLASVAARDFEKAVSLYKGSFLPDFGIPGGVEFEHWADRERDRLHSTYVRAAESLIRSRLDQGQYERAVAEAKRLRDFEPQRESNWRLLLEAVSSAGDHHAAVVEAEELERFLVSEDREPESLTRSAIARAKRLSSAADPDEKRETRLIADLTGRDREFARLTAAWANVRTGRFAHVHVTAPPGLGKTRLLRDVYARLRASGARAIWINAVAGEKRLAYALASDVVGKVGQLSGASGISTAAASSLVALNPKLSSSFAASPDRADGEEALRRRLHAMQELFECVADEAPLALFVDDLHWSDPSTRQLLKSAFSRMTGSSILLITSSRTVPDSDLHLPDTETISLHPLDRNQVEDMVRSVGSFGNTAVAQTYFDRLHTQTSGSPFLVLENLHLAIGRGLLQLNDGEWLMQDSGRLIDSISRGDALEQRLKKLDALAFGVMLILAVAEESLAPALIAATLDESVPTIEESLIALDQQAFATPSGNEWRCAHDSIAEAVLRLASDADRTRIHGTLGRAIAASGKVSDLRMALRHLEAGGLKVEAGEVFSRAVADARAGGDKRSNLQLAAVMLGETSPSDTAARLTTSLPFAQRYRPSGGRLAVGGVLLGAALFIPFTLQSPKAEQLALITQPLSANRLVVPPPVIEVQDRRGRRIVDWDDTVFVDMLEDTPGLTGTLAVAAAGGRAEFKDISAAGEGPITLRFRSKGLKDVTATTVNIRGKNPTLRFVSGRINGQNLTPENRRVVVTPGADIVGDVMLEYSSYWGSASVILGAAALWGDRRKNFLDLAPLFTPAENQPRRASIRFRAPDGPGMYHIVFAFDAEGNVEDFISGTNWRLPEPVWDDGNDIADWTQTQLVQANAAGWVMSTFVRIDDETGNAVREPHAVAATVIDIVVR